MIFVYGIERTIYSLSSGCFKHLDLITAFDLLLDQVVNTNPTINSEIPMFYTAGRIVVELRTGWTDARIARNASTTLCVPYHGYYVNKNFALTLNFLEHVTTKAIAQRPDCIFDSGGSLGKDNDTVCWYFDRHGFWDIWADILKDNGFDPDWVRREDYKRWSARTAETSTYEMSVEIDAARALDVKRRRGYVNTEE